MLLAIQALAVLPALPHAPLKFPGERQHFGQVLPAKTDSTLYKAILSDAEHGQGYYRAAAKEQRAFRYPTAPAETFRAPTLTWALSALD